MKSNMLIIFIVVGRQVEKQELSIFMGPYKTYDVEEVIL